MTVFRDLGTVRLETERLILRRFTEEDAEAAFRGWTGDDACAARCSWRVHPTPEYTRDILAHWIDEYEDNAYNWAVELKETHELIGTISTVSITRKHRNCEIGYCYGSRYWGKGYATEALRRAIDFLLSECGFHLVEADTSHPIPPAAASCKKQECTLMPSCPTATLILKRDIIMTHLYIP